MKSTASKLHRRSRAVVCALALAFCISVGACRNATPEHPKIQVRMTMLSGGKDPVLDVFARKMQDVEFIKVESPGGVAHVDSVEEGVADATLVAADIAYMAFNTGTAPRPFPHRKLRAMAIGSVGAMHLIAENSAHVHALADLKGLRVGIGQPGTNTEVTIRNVLPEIGIPLSKLHLEQLSYAEIPDRMANHSLDAAFLLTRYPASTVQNVLAQKGTNLVSLPSTEIAALRTEYPFFRHVTIPAETYGQPKNVETVGVNMVFVCREGLGEEIVYQMLDALFDSLPELSEGKPGYRGVSLDQAPATPIPLHPGAARFFRERQLFR